MFINDWMRNNQKKRVAKALWCYGVLEAAAFVTTFITTFCLEHDHPLQKTTGLLAVSSLFTVISTADYFDSLNRYHTNPPDYAINSPHQPRYCDHSSRNYHAILFVITQFSSLLSSITGIIGIIQFTRPSSENSDYNLTLTICNFSAVIASFSLLLQTTFSFVAQNAAGDWQGVSHWLKNIFSNFFSNTFNNIFGRNMEDTDYHELETSLSFNISRSPSTAGPAKNPSI